MTNLEEKLDLLAELKIDFELIKAEFEARNADLMDHIKDLEAEIRDAVLSSGETVRGQKMAAVWSKGRESWDGKILTGYAVAHPETLAAKKVGEPTVSFRQLK